MFWSKQGLNPHHQQKELSTNHHSKWEMNKIFFRTDIIYRSFKKIQLTFWN